MDAPTQVTAATRVHQSERPRIPYAPYTQVAVFIHAQAMHQAQTSDAG